MRDFYYQIKGRTEHSPEGGLGWAWPPVFSGLIKATDKKSAKEAIEEEYGRKFPLRVLRADIEHHGYLLHIREVEHASEYVMRRFQDVACKECGAIFKPIDKYNDPHSDHSGPDYCSANCAKAGKMRDASGFNLEQEGRLPAVIYQIRQKSTGKAYVGQTIRAFTLRWWQHLVSTSECKFHEALRSSPITDWEFSVIEVIEADTPDKLVFLTERERYWIEQLNTVNEGFNTVLPSIGAATGRQSSVQDGAAAEERLVCQGPALA